jgi:hypothetical protein
MTTRTRMLAGAHYASGHTSQEFDQIRALRQLVGGPITTRPTGAWTTTACRSWKACALKAWPP